MSKYIDAEKLIAEIEKLQQEVRNKWTENPRSSIDDGFLTACSRFLDIITYLQQKQLEVDLEKEINEVWEHDKVLNPYSYDKGYELQLDKTNLANLARHFYELGLNTRKDE